MDVKDESKAKGGIARAAKLSPDERRKIAKNAAEKRWKKKVVALRAKYQGDLNIGDDAIPCAVLEDETRVLISKGFLTALGRPWKGGSRTELPNFIGAKNLIPYVSDELRDGLNPLKYESLNGQTVGGYKAEILPLVCDVYLQAREDGKLTKSQLIVAKKAEILVRSLATIGIVALVDEATGYQRVRPQDALQKYLEKIVAKELVAWAKKFPDEFYENIYRLKNWPWPGMRKNRFSVVAHYTRDLVYERIAPCLLDELERKNPKDNLGRRKDKLHQWLTDDVGDPMLAQHLHSIIMFQRLALANGHGWKRFLRTVDQVLPKKGTTMELPFNTESD